MAAGGDLPHDLYTFVIEDALELESGFWGCVAAGATFKTLGRKPTPQGRAAIARHLDDLDDAEKQVNEIYFNLAGSKADATRRRTQLDASALARIGRARRVGAPLATPAQRCPSGLTPSRLELQESPQCRMSVELTTVSAWCAPVASNSVEVIRQRQA